MSKLEEIIDAATSDSVSTASLLRMVKVVSARAKLNLLDGWVDNELSGYPEGAALPDYRGPFQAEVVSSWTGPFQSMRANVPLPPSWAPEGLRDAGAYRLSFRQSVKELEQLVSGESQLGVPWDSDTVARLNGEIKRGDLHAIVPMHWIYSAHQQVSPAQVEGVLDNVRTRVLNFALEAERLVPGAGEPGFVPSDPAEINYMIVTNIYGNGNAVTVGSGSSQLVSMVQTGDRESLKRAVEAAGLPAEAIAELEAAIEGDEADGQPGLGSRVKDFLGKLTVGTAKETGKAALGVAGAVVTDLVRRYYGLV